MNRLSMNDKYNSGADFKRKNCQEKDLFSATV